MANAPLRLGASPETLPLSIAFINSTRKWGGVKTWTLDFGEALGEAGHRILAIVRPQTPFEEACRQKGFRVYPLGFGPKYNPVAVAQVRAILRNEKADVAVVNISKDLNVGAVAARSCGVPVVHRVGLVEDFQGRLEERLQHRFLIDRILVPSASMREGLLSRFSWLCAADISAIPNSKRLDRYGRRPKTETGAVVFGVTSQLSGGKGHGTLFRAVHRLHSRGVPIRLRVAGTGPQEEALKREAQVAGLSEIVEFCGFLRDVPGFLADLDAFVLPSLQEGFPNTLLEALCTGLPVVATALEGVREMVEDAGLLVPPGDAAPLAEAMERLVLDQDLRRQLGRWARARAEVHYDVGRNGSKLASLFQGLRRR